MVLPLSQLPLWFLITKKLQKILIGFVIFVGAFGANIPPRPSLIALLTLSKIKTWMIVFWILINNSLNIFLKFNAPASPLKTLAPLFP